MAEETGRVAPLTQRTIKGLEPAGGRYIVWDESLKGFGLRVEPSGAKTFLVRYRVGGGRTAPRKQFKIGRYGALTPDEAREAAAQVLARVELGEDPQTTRAKERRAETVAQLCDAYLASGCATKKASTITLDRIRIEGHIKPLIGHLRSTQVSSADVERMRDAVASGRIPRPKAEETKEPVPRVKAVRRPGERARGGKTAATKSVKLLRAIYVWAITNKELAVGSNPCDGVKTFADGRRERFLSTAELGRLGEALTSAEIEGAHRHHVRIVRLLALTGARKNEIAQLRWSEVQDGYLQLEDSKTGRKVVPLGAPAQTLLAEVEWTESPWVFPDPRDATLPIRNLDWAWVGFRKRAGLEDVRIHDLRHSFASAGVLGGATLFLIGKMLGHAQAATTQRYAHLADDPVRAAADRISARIDAALAGRPDPSAGELATN
ncbi:site-specific integrase [Phenylobacterium sp.]|uniref:tyrosine-type recombinase/integrase n=1 Tax=Phenylobacterium sp. TaxID=1871053 RepID=UPI0025FF7C6F|nr:site-specific integrase [Phenylobacterium sp.]